MVHVSYNRPRAAVAEPLSGRTSPFGRGAHRPLHVRSQVGTPYLHEEQREERVAHEAAAQSTGDRSPEPPWESPAPPRGVTPPPSSRCQQQSGPPGSSSGSLQAEVPCGVVFPQV